LHKEPVNIPVSKLVNEERMTTIMRFEEIEAWRTARELRIP
jgi:hypothetical protein